MKEEKKKKSKVVLIKNKLFVNPHTLIVRIFITVLLSEQWFTENNSLSILLTVQLFCLPRLSYAGGIQKIIRG
jgi:hypothetical protein